MNLQNGKSAGFACDHTQCQTACFLINSILAYRCMMDGLDCAYRMHVSGLKFCTHANRNDFSTPSTSPAN